MTSRVAWWASALASAAATFVAGASACGSAGSSASAPAPSAQAAQVSSAPALQQVVPGRTYFGRNEYVEFRAGDLPLVISAPHGGSLEPVDVPNRKSGTIATDVATEDLARLVAAALMSRAGREPSVVICRLKRTKIDVNRDIAEGAQGHAPAEHAWNEYHGFLDAACAAAAARYGQALVVDLHGHSHSKSRIEIGYLVGADDLDRPDAELDDAALVGRSSIRGLLSGSGQRFSAVVRGAASLGGLLERAGYPSVPAPAVPSPGLDPYYEGGYITRRHGSAAGGAVSAIQLETPFPGLRDTPSSRARFAAALADALLAYVSTHLRTGT